MYVKITYQNVALFHLSTVGLPLLTNIRISNTVHNKYNVHC